MIAVPHEMTSLPLHYLPHGIVGVVITLLGWLAKKVGENVLNQIKEKWNAMEARIDTVTSTTKVLMENHMEHVQADLRSLCEKQDAANEKSDKQIEVLTKISEGIAVLVDRGNRRKRD